MIVLDVAGMTCDGCAKAVQAAISSQDRNAVVVVDRVAGRVSTDTTLSADDVVAAVRSAGYDAAIAAAG